MTYIKINVRLLGRYPGMIISESDPHFEVFKAWAENNDRHGGKQICAMCDAPEEEKAEKGQEPAPSQPEEEKKKGKSKK